MGQQIKPPLLPLASGLPALHAHTQTLHAHTCIHTQVDVMVSPAESQALFRRFGFETVMPYEQFVHNLVTQPSRQLATDMPGERGCSFLSFCLSARKCLLFF